MANKDSHIPDPDLLLMTDGELSARRSAQVRAHLEACWSCRARMAEIEGTILDFARAYRELPSATLPPDAGARSLLSARLEELAAKSNMRSWRSMPWFSWARRTAVACLVVIGSVLVSMLALHVVATQRTEAKISSLERGLVPESRFTPGATRKATIDELCSSAHEEVIGQVTAPLRNEVLTEYGIAPSHAGEYEIDYLIAPGLGGTENIRNLWPQSYLAENWNAYDKDALEERLHQMVCGGELELSVAQTDIATDWIAAYKKYLHSDRPLPLAANLDSLDR